jgi:hypothetical protein
MWNLLSQWSIVQAHELIWGNITSLFSLSLELKCNISLNYEDRQKAMVESFGPIILSVVEITDIFILYML